MWKPTHYLWRTGGRYAKRSGLRVLSAIEQALLARRPTTRYAPVFILGVPRSGSTLLYQLLLERYRCAHFVNLATNLPMSPGIMSALCCRAMHRRRRQCFESVYGETPHWNGPSQGRDIWARWFPHDQGYVGPHALSTTCTRELQGTVAIVERVFAAPFLNKAQGHCGRIHSLIEAFPDALFVRISRPLDEVARSILNGRKEVFNDQGHWFSSKPSNYAKIRHLPPVLQVCEQVASIERDVQRDLLMIDAARVFSTTYAQLCDAPQEVVGAYGQFYKQQTGVELTVCTDIPPSFAHSLGQRLPPGDERIIASYLTQTAQECVRTQDIGGTDRMMRTSPTA